MASILTDLKENYKRGNLCTRLIYINTAIFVVTALVQMVLMLFNRQIGGLLQWFELPASLSRLAMQPWSLLTYMFMHNDLLHLLFNMLWLYWFGTLFLNLFSARHLRGLYLLGGLCGGALYILFYNLFPYFAAFVHGALLVGASASILAIVMATAYREPDYPVSLFLFGTVRLKYLALIVFIIDLLFIGSDNAGGHIAHVGGALAGLWFAYALNKGKDITLWLNRAWDGIASLFDRKPRKPKMKVSQGNNRQQDYDYNARKKAASDEIDRILDKLRKSGYESLTTEEKKSLFDASKR